MTTMRLFARLAAAIATFATIGATAQDFPARPVTIVVPFSAGGPTDTIARIVAERMSRSLGQTVVVENVTGAGGSIGVGKVVRSPPDGYTVSIGHIGTHVINGAVHQLTYDVRTDLEPVAMIATNPQIILSNNTVPATDLKSLIAWGRGKGSAVTSATGGPGTPAHVSGVYFQQQTGVPIEVIHYRGSGPGILDVIAGHVSLGFEQAANALPHIRAGKLRAYAVTSRARLAAAPDIPTVDEAGLPGFYMTVWHGLWVPKGTPPPVIGKLNTAVRETLADPSVQKRLFDLGQEIPAADQQSPEVLRAFHMAEIEKWWPVIRKAGIKGE
ncbi:MAG TPA: tripartite tricarboxylate transporter substrate-binding protein [Usitatibacter sp.]|nr:tripartite tricarboxylate transporter substrate-binding protein [Usitatibacter sp.]